MAFTSIRKKPVSTQIFISMTVVIGVSVGAFFLKDVFGYREIALILLMAVSVIAMTFEIIPVLISAVASALIWNFFFIPPLFTFHINNTEDTLLFSLYFLIALVNGVLSTKIRETEKKMREKEEKAQSIKLYNTLFNSLSHELRTPISTIIGSVDALQEEKSKLSAQQQDILLSEIAEAGERLNRQVGNLLNMSRLESGMLQPKPDWCDPEELFKQVTDKLPSHAQTIHTHFPNQTPLLKIDSGLVEQILVNLLHNAIQYTPNATHIHLTLETATTTCAFIVEDDGPGFPENEIPLVFEKFHRLPHSKAGGSGLGLSIVKGYVEALRGTVSLENRLSGGARFVVTIPVEMSYMNQLQHE